MSLVHLHSTTFTIHKLYKLCPSETALLHIVINKINSYKKFNHYWNKISNKTYIHKNIYTKKHFPNVPRFLGPSGILSSASQGKARTTALPRITLPSIVLRPSCPTSKLRTMSVLRAVIWQWQLVRHTFSNCHGWAGTFRCVLGGLGETPQR